MSKYKFKGEYLDRMMNRIFERCVKKRLIKDTDTNYDTFIDMMNKMFVEDWSHRKPRKNKSKFYDFIQE